ncbi:MAG TPA: urease accessory UreF family protein [Chloroflexota bacterium]|nr:urease accessory UreF family protein [Chloroflexota bacterium]
MSELPSSLGFVAALQLADTFFPSGAYTLSHGLETAVEDGLVRSPGDLESWLRAQVAFQVASTDGCAVVQSWRRAAVCDVVGIVAVDRQLGSFRLVEEARDASRKVGRRLLTTTAAIVDEASAATLTAYLTEVRSGRAAGHAPVALAVASVALNIRAEEAVLVALYSFSSAVLGAALRLLRIDHQATQAILFRLRPVFSASARRCLAEADEGYWAGAPLAEISAMRHRCGLRRSFMT